MWWWSSSSTKLRSNLERFLRGITPKPPSFSLSQVIYFMIFFKKLLTVSKFLLLAMIKKKKKSFFNWCDFCFASENPRQSIFAGFQLIILVKTNSPKSRVFN